MKNHIRPLLAAALLAFAAAGAAQESARPSKPKRPRKAPAAPAAPAAPEPPAKDPADEAIAAPGHDMASLKSYVRQRRAAIDAAHRSRLEAWEGEGRNWADFWGGLRDDRKKIELQLARQKAELFEMLVKVDARAEDRALEDLDRIQKTLVQAYEADEKRKVADFLADFTARLKEFSQQQERERTAFQAEADTAWRSQKASVREALSELRDQ